MSQQPQPPKEESATLSFGDLNKLIEEKATSLFEKLTGKDAPKDEKTADKPVDTPTSSSLEDQIQKGIATLREREAREAKEKERDDTIAGLVEKTKPKTPVERRRVHRFMGWGE